MEVLPQFPSTAAPVTSYWTQYFQQRRQQELSMDCYGPYEAVRSLLLRALNLPETTTNEMANTMHQTIKKSLRVLILACGACEWSKRLFQDGFTQMKAVDARHPQLMTTLQSLGRDNATYDLILDFGGLDLCKVADRTQLFSTIEQLLTTGGRFMSVTMAHVSLLRPLIKFFAEAEGKHQKWAIDVDALPLVSENRFVPHCVAVLKCPKGEKPSVSYHQKPFELPTTAKSSNTAIVRRQWLLFQVGATQWSLMARSMAFKKLRVGRQDVIELMDGRMCSSLPRFTLRLVDASLQGASGSCAVLVIPQGREHEWMFSSDQGAMELAQNAGYSRLILVSLGRGHHFQDMVQVQSALDRMIALFAPDAMAAEEQIPYLTLEEGLGERKVVSHGFSKVYGAYYVEEVVDDVGDHVRRLVLLHHPNLVESEMRLLPVEPTNASASTTTLAPVRGKKKRTSTKKYKLSKRKLLQALQTDDQGNVRRLTNDKRRVLDTACLNLDHERAMIVAFHAAAQLQETAETSSVLLLGLGGAGAVATYLHDQLPTAEITVCEADATMLQVATTMFGFQQDARLKVVIQDPVKFLAQQAIKGAGPYDRIVIDGHVPHLAQRLLGDEHALTQVCDLLHPKHGAVVLSMRDMATTEYTHCLDTLKLAFRRPNSNDEVVPIEIPTMLVEESDKPSTPSTTKNSVVLVCKGSKLDADKTLQQLKSASTKTTTPLLDEEELCEWMHDIQIA